MRIIKCDRCGAEIPVDQETTGYVALNLRQLETDDLIENNPFEHWDLCDECMKAIHAFITDQKAKPEPKKFEEVLESIDAGKKPKKAKPQKKIGPHKWDKDKAQALRDAGWKLTDIAAECGVHESTVRAHTIAPEPKKVYENEWAQHEPDLAVATRSMMGEKHLEEEEE